MDDEKIIFGMPKKEKIFDEYIGKYVVIYPSTGNNFGGKLVEIIDGFGILNPHQGGFFDKKQGMLRRLVYENSKVNMRGINGIEPTTKESLENYCYLCNKASKE